MYKIEEELTEEYILKYLSQEDIFSHFLNVKVELNTYFCSPLRTDNNPTCNFNWFNGKLWFRDWSKPSPKDCFQIVIDLYNCSFFEALQIIKRELIVDIPNLQIRKKSKDEITPIRLVKEKSVINVRIAKHWQPTVALYLKQYGITSEICRIFNIFPIDTVWLNKHMNWTYSNNDPAIGYYFGNAKNGDQRWKIYFFKRKNFRFLCNTNRINGLIQLPETGKDLIITKSLKDVAALYRLGYHAVSMQNETTEPYGYIIDKFKERFEVLWSFYDFDPTGVHLANLLKRKHDMHYLFLTNGRFNTHNYGSKDISDYIKNNSIEQAKELLAKTIPPF